MSLNGRVSTPMYTRDTARCRTCPCCSPGGLSVCRSTRESSTVRGDRRRHIRNRSLSRRRRAMTEPWHAIGRRAKIVDLLHSPARTRASGTWLIGRRGTIVNVLRNGTLALLELDGDIYDLPSGARRWPVHWDDLLLCARPSEASEPEDHLQLGLSGVGREAVQHAVRPGTEVAVCGAAVYPLPVCDWSVSFTAAAARACPDCARLAEAGSPAD